MALDVRDDGRLASAPSAKADWEGSDPAPRVDQVAKLRLSPSPNFAYLAHPFLWDVVKVDKLFVLVPILRELRFEPGVCNVKEERGRAEGDPNFALVKLARKGWVEIPAKIEVPTLKGRRKGYVWVFQGWQGPVHMSVWTRPVAVGGKVLLKQDVENFNRFRMELVTNGVVEPPDETILEALSMRFRNAVHARMHTKRGKAEFQAEVYAEKLNALEKLQHQQAQQSREVSDGE